MSFSCAFRFRLQSRKKQVQDVIILFLSNVFACAKRANDKSKYRHEYKYEIDNQQAVILEHRLSDVMLRDSYAGSAGIYEVRSLYFDDFDNTCFYENENGTDPREKFRIRIYNGSDVKISLELKRKESGKTLKRSCPITREQTEALIGGGVFPWEDEMDPLLKKFYFWVETKVGRPKVIVNYDRIPFVHPDGNVRVTLDLNVSASGQIDNFFKKELYGRPIMPVGKQVLEVKFDAFLPDHISHSIQTNALSRITYSKYYLCRKFGGLI